MPGAIRDTALFFDLENLLRGYGAGLARRVERLSVAEIVERITEVGEAHDCVTEFAVKRAYADWSKPQLAPLRRALVEHGIEPRQIFAFGSGGKTNAADVELVIDVLELASTRPEIGTFVIVSGDGGFGTLVRKLHEFGKTVVIGAYRDQAAKGLRAVADHFVELDSQATVVPRIGKRAASVIGTPQTPEGNPDALPAKVRELVALLAADDVLGPALKASGLLLGSLAKSLQAHLEREAVDGTFGNLSRLTRVALTDTQWCLTNDPTHPHILCLGMRDSLPPGHIAVEDLAPPDQLQRLHGWLRRQKIIVPNDPDDLKVVLEALAVTPIGGEETGSDLIERLLRDDRLANVEIEALRHSITLLRRAGILDGSGEGSLADVVFQQRIVNARESLNVLREFIRTTAGKRANDELLSQLLPSPNDIQEPDHDES